VNIGGQVALVTGAAAGAGLGIARALAAEGADVVAADLVPGPVGRFVRIDVTDDDALIAALDAAQPTILVNNAGGGGHVPPHFPDASPAEWGAWLDLNLRAPMLAAQRMHRGVVVNIASSAALDRGPHASPEYAAAKAGLVRFTTALPRFRDVRVNCVVPDWILTERAREELARMSAAERAAAPAPIPVDAVAAAVVALIADDSAAGRVIVLG
jgi:NAD(P)-dependent dehydrogenase (short-subunit alcohol dehydrogenase family)